MLFSPAFLSASIIRPLRYLFREYAPEELKWDADELKSKIEIDSINNFHKIAIQANPRVLISRGGYAITKTQIADDLAESPGPYKLKGLTDDKRFNLIQGTAQILIQARQEGTCEKVCDLVSHFLLWTSPGLCDSQGFKTFAYPLQVSPCTPGREDTEIFEISIAVPWMKEELWRVRSDALKLKDVLLNIS